MQTRPPNRYMAILLQSTPETNGQLVLYNLTIMHDMIPYLPSTAGVQLVLTPAVGLLLLIVHYTVPHLWHCIGIVYRAWQERNGDRDDLETGRADDGVDRAIVLHGNRTADTRHHESLAFNLRPIFNMMFPLVSRMNVENPPSLQN